MQTIPHLVKMSNFPFKEKVLSIDTAPLSGEKVNRFGVGTMAELRDRAQQLLNDKVVDRIVDVNYDPPFQAQVYQKHFGSQLRSTHNYKGYPILGSIFTIEDAKSDYMVHFDSDMLMYQNENYSWIKDSIQLIEDYPELISTRPLTGPPTQTGNFKLQSQLHPQSQQFYQYKFLSSRVYLIKRQKFDQLLPDLHSFQLQQF